MDIWHIIIVVQSLLLIVLYSEIKKAQTIQRLQMGVDTAFKDWLKALSERLDKIDKEEEQMKDITLDQILKDYDNGIIHVVDNGQLQEGQHESEN